MTAEELARLLQPAVGLKMPDYPIGTKDRTIIAVRELLEEESLDYLPGLVILEYEMLPEQSYIPHGPTCNPANVKSLTWYDTATNDELLLGVDTLDKGPCTFMFTGTPQAVAASLARVVTQEAQA